MHSHITTESGVDGPDDMRPQEDAFTEIAEACATPHTHGTSTPTLKHAQTLVYFNAASSDESDPDLDLLSALGKCTPMKGVNSA